MVSLISSLSSAENSAGMNEQSHVSCLPAPQFTAQQLRVPGKCPGVAEAWPCCRLIRGIGPWALVPQSDGSRKQGQSPPGRP